MRRMNARIGPLRRDAPSRRFFAGSSAVSHVVALRKLVVKSTAGGTKFLRLQNSDRPLERPRRHCSPILRPVDPILAGADSSAATPHLAGTLHCASLYNASGSGFIPRSGGCSLR